MGRQGELDRKYTASQGRVFMSGTQALVRLPLVQMRRDRAAGLNTAAFVSGYRGSPLGAYDQQLTANRNLLSNEGVHFQPGINEDLAATAVWGSQQLHLSPGARKQGVVGIWYGKGPGVDRSGDVFKHANAAGTAGAAIDYGSGNVRRLFTVGSLRRCLTHHSGQLRPAATACGRRS